MNTRQRLAAAAVAAFAALSGTAAFAQEATSDAWMQAPVSASRADVQQALKQARADGSIRFGAAGYLEKLNSTRSRDAVRAEVLAARQSGELAAINGEVYAYVPERAAQFARASR